MLTKLGYLIDNPWSNALDRARQAGAVLADILISRHMGVRPVSLVGFSLGARVIFYCLVELAKAKAFGVVQDVFLFGATLTAPKALWHSVRGVVSGRFVNAFAMNDWVLGYLFRATSGGLNTVAGLRPVDHVPDLENVDITEILVGHMSYRTLMPTLLAHVGFKTTADHFDEPEEMEVDAPDREVLTKEEEQKRKDKKEKAKMGIFSRRKKSTSQTSNGSNTMSREGSIDGDEDLPPRLDHTAPPMTRTTSNLSVSSTTTSNYQEEEEGEDLSERIEEEKLASMKEKEIPSGFNLDKIREEVAHLPKAPISEYNNNNTTKRTSISSPSSTTSPSSFNASLPASDLSTLESNIDPREVLRRQWSGEAVYSAALPRLPTPSMDNSWASTNPFASSTTSVVTPSSFQSSYPGGISGDAWGAPSKIPEEKKKNSFEDNAPDPASFNGWQNSKSTSNSSYKTHNPW